MRLILVTPHPPDPMGATGARGYAHLARELVRRGHEVRYVVWGGDPDVAMRRAEEFMAAAPAKRFRLQWVPREPDGAWRRKLRSTVWPGRPSRRCAVREAVAREVAAGYDVLQVEESGGWYGAGFERALLSVHNLQRVDRAHESPLEGIALWKEGLQARRSERQVIRRFRHLRCLTPELAREVGGLNPGAATYVVPAALEMSDYPLLPEPDRPPTIGLIGSMHWRPSREAARRLRDRIFPLVRERLREARLLVAGWNAERFLGPSDPGAGVEVVSDLAFATDFFRRIHVLVYAPARASGIKIKIAEAVAFGRAVVTTADGLEGLPLVTGEHCLAGESDADLAGHTVALLQDAAFRRRLALAGRDAIADHLSPRRTTDLMEGAYAAILGQ